MLVPDWSFGYLMINSDMGCLICKWLIDSSITLSLVQRFSSLILFSCCPTFPTFLAPSVFLVIGVILSRVCSSIDEEPKLGILLGWVLNSWLIHVSNHFKRNLWPTFLILRMWFGWWIDDAFAESHFRFTYFSISFGQIYETQNLQRYFFFIDYLCQGFFTHHLTYSSNKL